MAMKKKRECYGRSMAAAIAILIGIGVIPAKAGTDAMVIFLAHATLLHLSQPAERVIVGNPSIADVTVDSPKLVSVFGKTPGETNLIVLGAKDQTLLSRTIVVINAPNHAVSVHVPGKDGPTSRVYSCADGRCQHVRALDDGNTAPPPGGASAPNNAAKTDVPPPGNATP
jgi:Flp pilus assembly secretin CpaC